MKVTLEAILISADATVRQAMEAIDRGAVQIALVADENRRLLATVTDGDIRRGLLGGLSMDTCVSELMRSNPVTVPEGGERAAAITLMRKLVIHHVPVVDSEGRVVSLQCADDLIANERSDTAIVLMAGGMGARLRPLTENVPKPMLPIGGRPILETIIRNFTNQGYRKFYIAVKHRKEVLQNHFGSGEGFDAEIQYLEEKDRLGTAGALSLLPERPTSPFIVMNSDVLTSVKFENLLRFHSEKDSVATMCAREYTTHVPYGVISTEGSKLVKLTEKPSHTHFVNAGIYALSPEVLDHIAEGTRLDMPDLFQTLMNQGRTPSVFPIGEYWIDIGRTEDLAQARGEFDDVFGSLDTSNS